jgi:polysaccharide export outer membrane protein
MPVPPNPGAVALNSRLLNHVSTPGGEVDLSMGPGDLIEISVFEVEELSKLKLRIPLRGTITLPLIGQIPAAGRSAIQLEDDIRTRLQEKYIHDPQVSVFVHEHKSQRISVIGAVRKGGVFTITNPLRLADGLALAEGLTDDADHTIYLIRRAPGGTVGQIQAGAAPRKRLEAPAEGPADELMVPIDLEMLVAGRDDLNVALEAGDVIHVPRAGSYYVGGSVERPGSFFLKGKTTAEQGIMAAGGPRSVADWDDVRVYRTKPGGDREILKFSLTEFEKGNGEKAPELQKNDVVVVGKSGSKAFWFGLMEFVRGMFSMGKGF